MSDALNAMFIPEVDVIRVDLPGDGYSTSVLLSPDQAMRLATALKVALARRTPPPPRKAKTP